MSAKKTFDHRSIEQVDELRDLLDQTAERLGKRFDSIQIITTKTDSDGENTIMLLAASGNRYACIESTRQFLRNTEA